MRKRSSHPRAITCTSARQPGERRHSREIGQAPAETTEDRFGWRLPDLVLFTKPELGSKLRIVRHGSSCYARYLALRLPCCSSTPTCRAGTGGLQEFLQLRAGLRIAGLPVPCPPLPERGSRSPGKPGRCRLWKVNRRGRAWHGQVGGGT